MSGFGGSSSGGVHEGDSSVPTGSSGVDTTRDHGDSVVHPSSRNRSALAESSTEAVASTSHSERCPIQLPPPKKAAYSAESRPSDTQHTEQIIEDPDSILSNRHQTKRLTGDTKQGLNGSSEDEDDEEICILPKAARMRFNDEYGGDEEDDAATPQSDPTSLSSVDGTDLGQYKPNDLFDFQWQTFPETPIPSNLRRETFIDNNSGPRVHYAEPYDAFTAIWDRQIMEHICEQTNRYVQQMTTTRLCSQDTGWKDIDCDELYVYFAVVIAMGVVIKRPIEEYWDTSDNIFSTPYFRTCMPMNRFLLINRLLHFNHNLDMNSSQLSPDQAKLCKVQPILDHLNRKFSTLYNLSQNIAIDDSLTKWKGLKNSSAGIKTYELYESKTGYMWRFDTYCDSESPQNSSPIPGAIPAIVLRLIRGLEFKGHTLLMDSYYSSPALARVLKSMQFDCVGTLRINREYVPVQLSTLKKQMGEKQIVGFTSGDVDVLIWRGYKCVALMSTYHGSAVTLNKNVLEPIIVPDYNSSMDGLVKLYLMGKYNPIEQISTRVWYRRLFMRLFNISVFNSYIMYQFNRPRIDQSDFRQELIHQLLTHHKHT